MVCPKMRKMSKENPKINPQEIEQIDTLEEKVHEIILYNDDVNTFDHVIECLVKICDHTSVCKLCSWTVCRSSSAWLFKVSYSLLSLVQSL